MTKNVLTVVAILS